MNIKILFSSCILMLCSLLVSGQDSGVTEPEKQTIDDYFNNKKARDTGSQEVSSSIDKSNRRVSFSTYVQMVVVLIFVLFLIFLFFYLTKGKLKKSFIGNNGIEVICRASLIPKQSILVVRVGTRILILNATSDGHVSTLSEITDRNEIVELLSEVNKASRDNLFDSLLKRNQVLYDEELKNPDKSLEKIDRETDQLQEKLEKDKRV